MALLVSIALSDFFRLLGDDYHDDDDDDDDDDNDYDNDGRDGEDTGYTMSTTMARATVAMICDDNGDDSDI